MTLREMINHAASDERAEESNGRMTTKLRMSEKEFVEWCGTEEGVRAEWVDGEVIVMAPANWEHVDQNGWLCAVFRLFVESRDVGIVLGPDFTARFASRRSRRVPDLMFVSNARAKLIKQNHIEGAPDLIVEIVSPDSESRDRREKYFDYESAGVREYWIVDPLSKTVELYSLGRDGAYKQLNEIDGKLNSKVLKGLYLRPKWLWQSPLPKLAKVTKELRIR